MREETSTGGRQSREELARRIDTLAEALGKQVSNGRIESENHAKGLREESRLPRKSFAQIATEFRVGGPDHVADHDGEGE